VRLGSSIISRRRGRQEEGVRVVAAVAVPREREAVCSALQCDAVAVSMQQDACCRVLQSVSVRCNVLQLLSLGTKMHIVVCCSLLPCVEVTVSRE